jgi:hypothetical protein
MIQLFSHQDKEQETPLKSIYSPNILSVCTTNQFSIRNERRKWRFLILFSVLHLAPTAYHSKLSLSLASHYIPQFETEIHLRLFAWLSHITRLHAVIRIFFDDLARVFICMHNLLFFGFRVRPGRPEKLRDLHLYVIWKTNWLVEMSTQAHAAHTHVTSDKSRLRKPSVLPAMKNQGCHKQ